MADENTIDETEEEAIAEEPADDAPADDAPAPLPPIPAPPVVESSADIEARAVLIALLPLLENSAWPVDMNPVIERIKAL